MTKIIFITGGVVSSLGKGITASALATLLIARGFRVRLRKLDPYLNVDPGTMNPYQHGECFVTYDGGETDLDLGHYERFTGEKATKYDNVTSGQILQKVLEKERKGDFLGDTVQWIPHVTDQIKDFILQGLGEEDFLICEIGGTVGDIEGLPFLDAIRQIGNDIGLDQVLYLHVVLLPYLKSAQEIKTKPAQRSVKDLLQAGIQTNILVCRSEYAVPDSVKEKLALHCNVPIDRVFSAVDQLYIYNVVINYSNENLDASVLKYFHMKNRSSSMFLQNWKKLIQTIQRINIQDVSARVAIIGKYTDLKDAYISLDEALHHASWKNNIRIKVDYVNADELKNDSSILQSYHGIIVPGGYGERGILGKMQSINFARKKNIPFLGICYGAQLALIDIARHEGGLLDANSTEIDSQTLNPIIYMLSEWLTEHAHTSATYHKGTLDVLGGSMRLGESAVIIKENTLAYSIYKQYVIQERHRHRYEINIKYQSMFEKLGVEFSGLSKDFSIPEIIELTNHPWFIGVQYHPEFQSTPFNPHPLFISFIKAIAKRI